MTDLSKYYSLIEKVNAHFHRRVSRSAKSQHLAILKKLLESGDFHANKSMYNYLLPYINEEVVLERGGLYDETMRLYNECMRKYGNKPCSNFTGWDDVITFFNRNYMLERPLKNVQQLKLYDKRLDMYIKSNTLNKTTIYFLLYLLFYTE